MITSRHLAVAGAALALSGCCDSVTSLSLSFSGQPVAYSYPAATYYVTVGDTATVSAEARCERGDGLYGSVFHPSWFAFASTDTSVASFDGNGLLTARRKGRTTLSVASSGFRDSLILMASPAVTSLHVAAPSQARVGDTIGVLVTGLDLAGQSVDSTLVDVSLVPPSNALAAWIDTARFASAQELARPTPVSARLVAVRSGLLLITAATSHNPGKNFVAGDTASIAIQPL